MASPVTDPLAPVGRAARMRAAAEARCIWCGRRLPEQDGVGRRRRYCAQACRQRAYESRHALTRGHLPSDAVVLSTDEFQDLADRLFQVRCAAEDVATAVDERAGLTEIRALLDQLLATTRDAEQIR